MAGDRHAGALAEVEIDMSRHFDSEHDGPALEKCLALGLLPDIRPFFSDTHHTDLPFEPSDEAIGDALAYFLGTIYHEGTSVDEWRRVARALRVHGLKIANADAPPGQGTP